MLTDPAFLGNMFLFLLICGFSLSGVDGLFGGKDDETSEPETETGSGRSVVGTDADEVFSGTAFADMLLGMAGDDTILGGADNDSIEGNVGDDSLLGGDGNDILAGGAGTDWIDGGAGDDRISSDRIDSRADLERGDVETLNGGDGNDTMLFSHDDVIQGGAGNDTFEMVVDRNADGPATLRDFDDENETISLFYEPLSGETEAPGITVSQNQDSATTSIQLGGQEVLRLDGLHDIVAEDIRLTALPAA